jgi:hypothetical protein
MSDPGYSHLFDCNIEDLDPKLVFILMPFKSNITRIYETIVKPTIESVDELQCIRADDYATSNAIIRDISEGICKSRFIVADITGSNPNVMYELGVSHALKKDVIILYRPTKAAPNSPFDIAHIRLIKYTNSAAGGQEMKKRLLKHVENILSRPVTKPIGAAVKGDIRLEEIREMVEPQYKIHQTRIHSFTYHSIHNFRTFRQKHLDLIGRIEQFERERTEQSLKRIKSLSKVQSRRVDEYLIPFTKGLYNEYKKFIQDGWLSYSFLTELHMIGGAMKYIKEVEINPDRSGDTFEMKSAINEQIQRIDLCIDAMERERESIQLSPV